MVERVLITGARSAAALDLARDFVAAGYEVHAADCAPARIARWSRAPTQVHRYPSPVRDPGGFRDRIGALAAALEPLLIVPTCEEVFHLTRAPLDGRLFQPSALTLRQLHDKGAFVEFCRTLGLPAPETHPVDNTADLEPFAGESEAWVFKARYGRFGEATWVGPDRSALARLALGRRGGWIAQRRIVGREVSFYAVARHGEVTAFAAYGSRWRLSGGASLTFDPVEPEVTRMLSPLATALAAGAALHGQFACDVMLDQANRPWLIECNPRATSGLHLLVGDGRLARAMLSTPTRAVTAHHAPRHLLPAFAIFGLHQAARAGRVAEWWAQLRAGKDVAGRPGDRWPVAGAVIDGLAFAALGRLAGVSTSAASTADIEWNGEALP